jgi:hypothetical protein
MSSFMAQIAETTLATGHATIEQRLARWLLMAVETCRSRMALTGGSDNADNVRAQPESGDGVRKSAVG